MKSHTDLLNYIAKKINAEWYLEIGTFNPDHNFNHIKVKNKISVDPDPKAWAIVSLTSDEFFKMNKLRFDLIFIDGLHHADQVKKDIINAWECLSDYGVIVVHDCNPHKEEITSVPRMTGEWCGDVFKTISQLTSNKITLDFDYGCCCLFKTPESELTFADFEVTWELFNENKKKYLNLVTVENGLKSIDKFSKTLKLQIIE